MAIYKYDKKSGQVIEIKRKPRELAGEAFTPFYSEDWGVMVESNAQFEKELKEHKQVRTMERYSKNDMIRKLEKNSSNNPDFLRQRERLIKKW